MPTPRDTIGGLMNRRRLLSHLNRAAVAWALHSLFAPLRASAALQQAPLQQWPGRHDPFTLGVASGEPRDASVVLWTRLAPQPLLPDGGLPAQAIAVSWELADDPRFARIVRRGDTVALPEHAHSVHVEVAGLRPGRHYFYRFLAGGHASAVGRTRTAPAPDADVPQLRLALASCQHYEHGYFAVHREIASRDLDCVLFVGDYIYETSHHHQLTRQHLTPTPHDLSTFRQRYASYKLDPDLQAAHAAHPWLLTWDDHEVENDYYGVHSGTAIPDAEFLQRRADAYKAYFEHQPVSPAQVLAAQARIHDRYVWGQLAELWTLDTRQFRDEHACTTRKEHGGRMIWNCADLDAPQRSVLGAAQEQWLAGGLASSQRTWKLIGQTTQMSPSTVDVPLLGHGVLNEIWDGYPAARARLLRSIAEPNVQNVLCLGGDVHRHVAARLRLDPRDPRSPVVASEFVCSSVTSHGLPEWFTTIIERQNPDTLHIRSDERGYALLEITPQQAVCEFRATAHPVQPKARLYTQGRWAVEAGAAASLGPQRA